MAKIFIFRHAQTPDNVAHTFSGKRDPDLTKDGIEEAEKIRDTLKNEKVTKAYCAPNKRTKHTLEIVLEHHVNVEMVADPRLNERDYGDLTGKNKDEIANKFPKEYPIWHRSYDVPPPGGESYKQVDVRVMEFLKEMLQNLYQNDVIFISASGNSIRPMRKHFEKMTNEEMSSYENIRGKIYIYEVQTMPFSTITLPASAPKPIAASNESSSAKPPFLIFSDFNPSATPASINF